MVLLALAYGGAAAANLLLSITVGRGLGAAALGEFALAVAGARGFYAATDLGIGTHLARTIARDRTRAGADLSRFVVVRAGLVPIAIAIAVAIAHHHGSSAALVFAFVALALGLVTIQGVYEAALLALARPRLVAILNATSAVVVIAGCGAWWIARTQLPALAACYAVATFAGVATWAYCSHARLPLAFSFDFDLAATARALRRCWPIGASTVLAIAALRAPVLVLGAFARPEDVGAFVAVDTFVTAAGILQVAITNTALARLASSFRSDRAAFRAILWRTNGALAAFGIAIASLLTLWGGELVAMLFSAGEFERVAEIAPIIAWSAPALLLVHHNIYVFAAADAERANLAFMVVWFAAVAGAQLALVPGHGLAGAAWGLLLGRTLGLLVLSAMIAPLARSPRGRDR